MGRPGEGGRGGEGRERGGCGVGERRVRVRRGRVARRRERREGREGRAGKGQAWEGAWGRELGGWRRELGRLEELGSLGHVLGRVVSGRVHVSVWGTGSSARRGGRPRERERGYIQRAIQIHDHRNGSNSISPLPAPPGNKRHAAPRAPASGGLVHGPAHRQTCSRHRPCTTSAAAAATHTASAGGQSTPQRLRIWTS